MKLVKTLLVATLALGGSVVLVACQSTHKEGVTSDLRTQWTNVNADTKATTDAAKAVLMADDLKNVKAESTDIDGKASAMKADGTKISVSIKKMDAMSQVSVTVGMLGDSKLGADYASRIKMKAEGH